MSQWNPKMAGHSLPQVNAQGEVTGFVYHLPAAPHEVVSEPLSSERLEKIRRRVPEVYTGPWHVDYDPDGRGFAVMYATDNPLAGLVAEIPDYGENLAHFIAHAREDVPALLAEIHRLRTELEARPSRADVLRSFATRVEEMREDGDPSVWLSAWEAVSEVIDEAHRLAADATRAKAGDQS